MTFQQLCDFYGKTPQAVRYRCQVMGMPMSLALTTPLRKLDASKRHEAYAAGQITFSGEPCAHGHSGLRYSKNNRCVECNKQQRGKRA